MHGNQKFSNFLEPCSDIDNDSEQQIIDFVLFCFVMYFFLVLFLCLFGNFSFGYFYTNEVIYAKVTSI